MALLNIIDILNRISESIGLPPIALIIAMVFFSFVFIFGLVHLVAVRSIRRELSIVNKKLDFIKLMLQSDTEISVPEKTDRNSESTHSKTVLQQQVANKPAGQSSNKFFISSDANGQGIDKDENSSNSRAEEFKDIGEKAHSIKDEIINFLKLSGGAVPYNQIKKHVSNNSSGSDTDFDLLLAELENLEKERKLVSQVIAGKLYFKIVTGI